MYSCETFVWSTAISSFLQNSELAPDKTSLNCIISYDRSALVLAIATENPASHIVTIHPLPHIVCSGTVIVLNYGDTITALYNLLVQLLYNIVVAQL